jgi:uncharacterized membrane protein
MGLIGKVMTGNYDSTATFPPVTGSAGINVGTNERIISVAAGAILAGIGLTKLNREGIALAIAGGALILRGSSGYCPINTMIDRNTAESIPKALTIRKSIRINRSRPLVYKFWRQLENLPKFMTHLKEVKEIDSIRSKWIAAIPANLGDIEWEAEILRDDENKLIRWQSLPGSTIDNSGEVRFQDSGDNKTLVLITLSYRPPLGDVGNLGGKIFNPIFKNLLKKDLEEFKTVIEGHIAAAPNESFLESSQTRLQSEPVQL